MRWSDWFCDLITDELPFAMRRVRWWFEEGRLVGWQLGVDGKLPGNFDSLARKDRSAVDGAESHDYTMKIVPTLYENAAGHTVVSYQYTYASTVRSERVLRPFPAFSRFLLNFI